MPDIGSSLSVRPELVEGPFFSSLEDKERCFDKLSTNGKNGHLLS